MIRELRVYACIIFPALNDIVLNIISIKIILLTDNIDELMKCKIHKI